MRKCFLPRMNRIHTDDMTNAPVGSGRDPTSHPHTRLYPTHPNSARHPNNASDSEQISPKAIIVSAANKHRPKGKHRERQRVNIANEVSKHRER